MPKYMERLKNMFGILYILKNTVKRVFLKLLKVVTRKKYLLHQKLYLKHFTTDYTYNMLLSQLRVHYAYSFSWYPIVIELCFVSSSNVFMVSFDKCLTM